MGTRIDRRFDYLKKQTEQDASRVGQEQQDQLARQAASRGRLGSGSYQKQVGQQQQQLASMKQNALEGVESQREAALSQVEEAQANRDFAKSERLGSQDFNRELDQKAWDRQNLMFNTQRADAKEQFQFSKDMAVNEFNARDLASIQAQKNWESQFKTQGKQWAKQFKLDKRVSEFNMKMAERAQTLAEKPGIFDRFMSPFGAMGSGFGGIGDSIGSSIGGAVSGGGGSFSF